MTEQEEQAWAVVDALSCPIEVALTEPLATRPLDLIDISMADNTPVAARRNLFSRELENVAMSIAVTRVGTVTGLVYCRCGLHSSYLIYDRS